MTPSAAAIQSGYGGNAVRGCRIPSNFCHGNAAVNRMERRQKMPNSRSYLFVLLREHKGMPEYAEFLLTIAVDEIFMGIAPGDDKNLSSQCSKENNPSL